MLQKLRDGPCIGSELHASDKAVQFVQAAELFVMCVRPIGEETAPSLVDILEIKDLLEATSGEPKRAHPYWCACVLEFYQSMKGCRMLLQELATAISQAERQVTCCLLPTSSSSILIQIH